MMIESLRQIANNGVAEWVRAIADQHRLPFPRPVDPDDEPLVREYLRQIASRIATTPTFHVVELTTTGWCLMHPLICDPDLFACPYNVAAELEFDRAPDVGPGRYALRMDDGGGLLIGERLEDAAVSNPPVTHASPGCACGVNEAGMTYVDPICHSEAVPS